MKGDIHGLKSKAVELSSVKVVSQGAKDQVGLARVEMRASIAGDVRMLKEDVTSVEGKINILQQDIAHIKHKIVLMKSDVCTRKHDLVTDKTTVSSIKMGITDIQSVLQNQCTPSGGQLLHV